MTRAGIIPLSDIERIHFYFNTKKLKSTKSNLKKILQQEGGSFITSSTIFLKNLSLCTPVKAEGKVKCDPGYGAWCISWNTPMDFAIRSCPKVANPANYMACVKCIVNGQKIAKMDYQPDMKYKTHRLAYGTKDGALAYYATQDNISPETLQDRLYDLGWDGAVMMDGGGSVCWVDSNGEGFVGDGRVIPVFIIVTLKSKVLTEGEPEGEKPMDFEIKAYSLKKEGEDFLTEHFQVKEFACNDGSDTVFIADKLPMVCEYVRMRCGTGVKPSSGYRTPTYNARPDVQGEEFSMHLYGAAADLLCPAGVTPKQMAKFAREIMPRFGGVGIYSWGVHVDVSPTFRNWIG